MTTLGIKVVACPQCQDAPIPWVEKPRPDSYETYWIGCPKHKHAGSGRSEAIAIQNWNRTVVKWSFDNGGPQ